MRDGHALETGQYQRATRGRLPQWYLDAPMLRPGDEFYLQAFFELSTERSFGMGAIGPIPWSRIIDYGQRAGLDKQMQDVLVRVLRTLDEEYLKWQREQEAANQRRMVNEQKNTVRER